MKSIIGSVSTIPVVAHHLTIRTVLLWLVLACLLPGMTIAAVMFVIEYRHGRAALEQDMIATARAMVRTVDSRLLMARNTALTLTTSGSLIRGDLAAFHQRAHEVITQTDAAMNVVVSDVYGRQLVNTLRDHGAVLPRHGNPESLRRVLETGQPVISNVYLGGVLRKPLISVDVPVRIKDDEVRYVLSIGVNLDEFAAILAAQRFPAGWLAAVFDAEGTIAARTLAPEKFVGQKGTAGYIERIRQAEEGVMETFSREGLPTYSVWSRSPQTGWSVGIGIERSVLEQPLRQNLLLLAGIFFILLLLGLGLAWLAARRISGALDQLGAQAVAMRGGAPLAAPAIHTIREASSVALAMEETARQLAAHATEIEQTRQAHLQELEQQVATRTASLRQANEELERLNHVDMLTGLQNRPSANARLRQEFLRMKRVGSPYVVLFIDIDHFKHVNDTYGHQTGDEVLRQLAALLQGAMRTTDFVARYGGEEFLVILPDTGMDGARIIAEKIRQTVVGQTFGVAGRVTISIGLSEARGDDLNEEVAVSRADQALYDAKGAGRNRVAVR